MICSASSRYDSAMEEIDFDSPGGRLRWARSRTYETADAFARVMRVNDKTYRAYENNQNGFARRAPEFAEKLKVPTNWLLRGGPIPETSPPSREDIEGASARPVRSEAALPALSSEVLAGVVAEIMEMLAPGVPVSEATLRLVGAALRDSLVALAADPDAASEPATSRAVARALAGRLQH